MIVDDHVPLRPGEQPTHFPHYPGFPRPVDRHGVPLSDWPPRGEPHPLPPVAPQRSPSADVPLGEAIPLRKLRP